MDIDAEVLEVKPEAAKAATYSTLVLPVTPVSSTVGTFTIPSGYTFQSIVEFATIPEGHSIVRALETPGMSAYVTVLVQ
jgi:hypothetical protein